MTVITNATYLNGVFKTAKQLNFTKKEKVCLVAVSEKEWKKRFSQLLGSVHSKTAKFHKHDIEKDISLASKETRK